MPVHADPPPAVVYDPTGLQYQTEKQLGRGGFAICWQAQQTRGGCTPGKTVALKIVKSKLEPLKLAQKFVTELQLHSKLHGHPNIVEFYRAFSFESSTYVVLEVCTNGSLSNCLKRRSYLSMPEIRRYIIQTCGAVKYLHQRNIVHRDLKTGNLFLDDQMNIKVGDFGLAAVLVGPHDAVKRRTTMCGTPNYIAPEVLEKNGKGHNEKIDIWAIGIIAYTLAIGKAPFHASQPQEVLNKVARGVYAWPDLARHDNIIPGDLCEVVPHILVDENSRPSLDAIVSHRFFKMGYLPETLSNSAITATPKLAIRRPTPAAIERGYTACWYKQCKTSGVGEYAPGRFFSSAGKSMSGTIYRECEREGEAGKVPIVPMPNGAVYTPFVYKKGMASTGGLENSEDLKLSAISSPLMETSVNTKNNISGPVEAPPSKQQGVNLQNPVPPKPSPAKPPASSYAGTTRNARRPAASRSKKISAPAAKSATMKLCGRSRPRRASPQPWVEEPESEPKQSMIEHRPIRPSCTRLAGTFEPIHPTGTAPRDARAEASPLEAVQTIHTTTRTAARADMNRPATRTVSQEHAPQVAERIPQPGLPSLPSTMVVAPRSKNLATPESSLLSLYTDPATILARARELQNTVINALTSHNNASSALRNWEPPNDRLPLVSKWVDYSKKYGIGYALANGKIGAVVNHTDDRPLTHVVVNHGHNYLKNTYGNPTLKAVPFQFFTQADDGSLEEATMSGADRKQNSILWAKFGRYMCTNLNEETSVRAGEQVERPNTIVRYYQRLGNVSVWGFSNGCFQFNFSDHTKLVLSADGKYISFTALPLPAIAHMTSQVTSLPYEYIRAREVLCGTIYQLLYGSHPTLGPISISTSTGAKIDVLALTTANALPAKLRFVADVVGLWVSGGGLGCKPARRRWPEWEDKTPERDAHGSKPTWTTVGRFGGDGIPEERRGFISHCSAESDGQLRAIS